jgi:hypothetical protein
MNAKQVQLSSKNIGGTMGNRGWLLGAGLFIVAALAVSVAIFNAPTKTAPEAPIQARLVTALNAQSVRAHPNLHYIRPANRAQPVPDAATQGILSYLGAHGAGLAVSAQSVPDAATQGILRYLGAHGAGQTAQLPAIRQNPAPAARHGAACDELPAATRGCTGQAMSVPSNAGRPATVCVAVSRAAQHWADKRTVNGLGGQGDGCDEMP